MVSKKLLPSASTTTLKRTRLLAMSVILLSALAVTEVSYAAGRIFSDGFESGNTNLWQQDNTPVSYTHLTLPTILRV